MQHQSSTLSVPQPGIRIDDNDVNCSLFNNLLAVRRSSYSTTPSSSTISSTSMPVPNDLSSLSRALDTPISTNKPKPPSSPRPAHLSSTNSTSSSSSSSSNATTTNNTNKSATTSIIVTPPIEFDQQQPHPPPTDDIVNMLPPSYEVAMQLPQSK